MTVESKRPLSPHLQVYKWELHMLVSILNRFMGIGLAIAGTFMFVAWLMALASGEETYKNFMSLMTGYYYLGYAGAIGLTFAFFFHLCAGLRHFVLDAGAGFELTKNKLWAGLTLFAAVLLTAGTWLIIFGKAL